MRIAYLHQYFNTPDNVGSTRSYEIGRHLVKSGHEVHMITSDHARRFGKSRGWHISEEAGIKVYWLAVPYSHHMSYPQRVRSFLRFAWGAALKAASLEADVILATSTPLTIVLPALYAKALRRTPMVFEVRDLWPAVPIAMGILKHPLLIAASRWLEQVAYRNASQIVALSPDMKQAIARKGYPTSRIHVLPNGAGTAFFQVSSEMGRRFRAHAEWLGERPLVVYAGTIGRVNGVGYLAKLAAITQSLNPDIRFLVVGDGVEKKQVLQLANRLGVYGQNFFMLDPVPKRDILTILSAADIATSLVIDVPALWANSANKFFESLATGTPVAINYRGWQAELLERSGAGLVLHAEDVDGAAHSLAGAIADREWLRKAGTAARTLARRYSWSVLSKQLEEILRSAAMSEPARR